MADLSTADIAVRITELIRKSGLSVADYAIKCGADPKTLAEALAGEGNFSIPDILCVAWEADVPFGWLVNEKRTIRFASHTDSGYQVEDVEVDW